MQLKQVSQTNCLLVAAFAASTLLCALQQVQSANNSPQPQDQTSPSQPISSRLAFLRAQRAAAASRQAQLQSAAKNETAKVTSDQASGRTSTVVGVSSSTPTTATSEPPKPLKPESPQAQTPKAVSATAAAASSSADNNKSSQVAPPPQVQPTPNVSNLAPLKPAMNRTTRTADVFQNGEGFNIFVTNTCEREVMRVNIKTSRPFYGVIHTRQERQKAVCSVEGNGESEYNLDLNLILNQQDANYCGVIKARKESPEDKEKLSVVLAVRVHRTIELSDDKFFLLNCTNRCRKSDCSVPLSARLTEEDTSLPAGRFTELEGPEREGPTSGQSGGGNNNNGARRNQTEQEDECTIWKFPWIITLLWCMGILLLAMIISHCIMCSSLVCRCVKREVEEREPSVYEGATDDEDEDSLYNKKTHPMRIDYDNRDIYKTSNNYEPYSLDDDCRPEQKRSKSDHSKSRNRTAR